MPTSGGRVKLHGRGGVGGGEEARQTLPRRGKEVPGPSRRAMAGAGARGPAGVALPPRSPRKGQGVNPGGGGANPD